MADANDTQTPDIDGMVDTLRGSSADTAVLKFAEKQMDEQRSWFGQIVDKFMAKGDKPSALRPDPDNDGDRDYPPGTSLDTDGDSMPQRGAGHLMKGMMCKGEECGFKTPMHKGHPHFGARRAPAEEVCKGMHCPRCGQKTVAPIMLKGEEEMDAPDDADMGKGLQHADIDHAVQTVRRGADAAMHASEAIPGIADAILDMQDMIKGLVEQIETLSTTPLEERLNAIEANMDKGLEFQAATLDQFEAYALVQDGLKGAFDEQSEMLKGLEMHVGETAELIKGIEPRTPRGAGPADRSSFDRAAQNIRAGLPKPGAAATDAEMNKGAEGGENSLSRAELDRGVALKLISAADVRGYELGLDLPNGFGRDVTLFRRKIA